MTMADETPTERLKRIRTAARKLEPVVSGSGSWNTDSADDYTVDKFYTRGDKTQQTKQVRVYIPMDQIAIIEQLVQGKSVVDYKTMQDVIRDALHHRLRWVDKEMVQTPESAQRVRMMQMRADAENITREIAENDSTVAVVESSLGKVTSTGDRAKLHGLMSQWELQAEQMDEPWRSRVYQLIETFGGEIG